MSSNIDSIPASAYNFSDKVIKPNVDDWEASRRWSRDASDKAASQGLTGLHCPDGFGGQGLSLGDDVQVYEELGKGEGVFAFALSMQNICAWRQSLVQHIAMKATISTNRKVDQWPRSCR